MFLTVSSLLKIDKFLLTLIIVFVFYDLYDAFV